MSGATNLKWHGSTVAFSIGWSGDSPSNAVTAITKASPAVVTSASHGLVNGDVVKLEGVVGMTELNGKVFVVEKLTDDTFKLLGSNSLGYTTYVSGGFIDVAELATPWCQLTGYNRTGGTAAEEDITTICSTEVETELGLPDFGTTQLDYLFDKLDTTMAAIQAADLSKDVIAVRVVLPKNRGSMVQLGQVQQTSEQAGNGTSWTGSTTIRNRGRRWDF